MSKSDRHHCNGHVHHGRMGLFSCSRAASVTRDGKYYCGTHDPVRVEERREASERKWRAKVAADDAIVREAKARAKQLGAGVPYYGPNGYQRAIVLSFDAVDKLIARLARGDRKGR